MQRGRAAATAGRIAWAAAISLNLPEKKTVKTPADGECTSDVSSRLV